MKKWYLLVALMLVAAACIGCTGENDNVSGQGFVLDGFSIDWGGDTAHHQVGEDITINDAGQIIKYENYYGVNDFSYNDDGSLAAVTTTSNKNDTVGTKTFTYNEGKLTGFVYDPNDGFHSKQEASIELQTDDDGKVNALTENITYTDSEDGSVSKGINKYEYSYGSDGQLSTVTYSSDGDVDNITTLSYDNNGNLLRYSSAKPDTGDVYLEVNFEYKMVNENTVSNRNTDSFAAIYDWQQILKYIL